MQSGPSETALQQQNSLIRGWYDQAAGVCLEMGQHPKATQNTASAVEKQITEVFGSVEAGNLSATTNHICEHVNASSDSPQPIGSIVGQLLFGTGALPYSVWMRTISWPGDVPRIKEAWVPRVIGTVRSNETAASFDGGSAMWRVYGRNVTDTKGNFVRFSTEPRLAFVDGWGKGIRRLYGTYLATAERICIDGFICIAVQRIVPSTDVSSGMVSGIDAIIFEAVEQNITWIPMAIGSVDLAGTFLTVAGDVAPGVTTFFMHLNGEGDYSTKKITLTEIRAWQMQIINAQEGYTAGEESSTLGAKNAQRRYWQVVKAVKDAAVSDNVFYNVILSSDSLMNLYNEGNRLPSDRTIYLPDFSGKKPKTGLPVVALPSSVTQQQKLEDALRF